MLDWNPREILCEVFKNAESIPLEFLEVFQMPHWLAYDAGKFSRSEVVSELPSFFDKAKFAYYESQLSRFLRPKLEMVKLFETVKEKKYKTYILSNMPKEIFAELQEFYDIIAKFDGKIISSHVGYIKPDPKIYQTLLTTYSLKPEGCFFIDDRDENILSAKALRIDGITFENPDQLRHELRQRRIL